MRKDLEEFLKEKDYEFCGKNGERFLHGGWVHIDHVEEFINLLENNLLTSASKRNYGDRTRFEQRVGEMRDWKYHRDRNKE